jgi:hypothetical protein
VLAAAGGTLLLALIAGGAFLLSSRDDAAHAQESAQASAALRALPPAPPSAPVPAQAVLPPPAANDAPPAPAGAAQAAAGGQGAVLTSGVAKPSDGKPAGNTEAATLTVKTERAPGTSRTSRRKDTEEGARGETAESSRPAAKGTGKLKLVMKDSGWGIVFIDDEEMGEVPPMNDLKLPAGRYQLAIRGNPGMHDYEETVTVVADDTTVHVVVQKRRDK